MDRHDTLLLAGAAEKNRELLRATLGEHYNLLEASGAAQALLLLEQNIHCTAALVLDMTVPEAADTAMLQSDAFQSCLSRVPLIAAVSGESPENLQLALSLGAADAIDLHCDPAAMLHRIENVIRLGLQQQMLEQLALEQREKQRHDGNAMVDALSSIIEYRSAESGQHILRIRHFTKLLLEEVARCCPEYGLNETAVGIISSASALHDIGKISIADTILTKPGPLTPQEREIMKSHTLTGCSLLRRLGDLGDPEYMRYAHNICHYHHERWDGKGYPEGLSGDDIPICAQVVGLADVYDALTTRRVYKEAVPCETAVNMILNGESGTFSPKLLECFKHVADDYAALARAYADGLDPVSENFDVTLPLPAREDMSGMDRTYAKYQALVHYAGAFLMELDMDQKLFHLIYNPYPEFVDLRQVTSFRELERLALDTLVVPSQREQLRRLIREGIPQFFRDGLRRVNQHFRFRSAYVPEGEEFVVTLLRIRPAETQRHTLALLCRRAEGAPAASAPPAVPAEGQFRCRYDRELSLIHPAPGLAAFTGYTPGELQSRFGGSFLALLHPEDRADFLDRLHRQLTRGTTAVREVRIRHRSGAVLWFLIRGSLQRENGTESLVCSMADITCVKESISEMEQKLNRYEIILAQTENVLFDWELGSDTISFSDTWERIFGFAPISSGVREALMGGSFFHPDDLPRLFDKLSALEGGSGYEMVEVRIATARGRYLWLRFRATAIRDEAGQLVRICGIIINIDAEKQAEQALRDQAKRDSLTKLLNKDASRRQAEEYFAQFASNLSCALLIIDLDDFKLVNDHHGHLFGDAVLTRAAGEIKKLFRTQDIIARIGGDEFMVLMRGISDRKIVENRCARLIGIFRSVFREGHYRLPLSCSIGIALGPEHGKTYVELFRRADQALYQAKDQGKDSFCFYSPMALISPAHSRRTAVSASIDSDSQPGLANENIVRHAFQRLYSAADVPAAINDILALVGRQMNVSRVYVFENSDDNRFCSNTYEWCNEGIAPEIQNLQNISYETDIPNYEDNFNEEGIFYCPDVKMLPPAAYEIVKPQGIQSMLHCAIRDNGVFRGYIGFDECKQQRFWTREQIHMLTYFSEMLAVFLLKRKEQERSNRWARQLTTILDNQNAFIYIIDPDTCELKYLNARTKALAPAVTVGMRCYEALLGCDSRCENCPSADIRRTKNAHTVIENRKFGMKALAEATLIQWEGRDSCLLTCRRLEE